MLRAHRATTTIQEENVCSLASPTGGEGRGEEADLIGYPSPLTLSPDPLPARSSRGEGEDFWWLYQNAPECSSMDSAQLPKRIIDRRAC